ncbi:MAG: nucleoside hydrolase [Bacteroidales bacterium]|nr:nucleoside hydrolase [Bacteroidales bacterium]
MKIIINILIIFLILTPLNLEAHKRAIYNLIIDTDGGQDDFRALSLFAASAEFNINAITSVDGVLNPDETSSFVKSLMEYLGHDGILIASGLKNPNKTTTTKYREFVFPHWHKLFSESKPINQSATETMYRVISNERKATVIVALGPLTNIKQLIEKHPEALDKIGLIIWYNNTRNISESYNYQSDPESFDYLISVNAPLKLIYSAEKISYTKTFNDDIKQLDNAYANIWYEFHDGMKNHRFEVWDELSVLYLLNPIMFKESYSENGLPLLEPSIRFIPEVQISAILNIDKSLGGVIYNEIPTEGQWLVSDSRNWTDTIVKKFGYPEFKIVALTSEFHSHLGTYSIVGAKLGMRAMEYFHVGLDEINVISYAGFMPPLSCLNDGLQFGTGATLGYGNISVDTNDIAKPAATITYNGRSIYFELKEEWYSKIENDIEKLVNKYGLDSELYWTELREISFQYWLDMDRKEIFNIKEL